MSAAASPYDLARARGEAAGVAGSVACASTGASMPPGTPCRSVLVPAEEDDADGKPAASPFRRVDVSEPAWEAGDRPAGVFSHWRSRVPDATAPRREPLDLAGLLELLAKLAEDENADHGRSAFRFVLALLLMRRRMLRLDDTRVDGDATFWCFTRKEDPAKGPMGRWAEGETIEVPDPGLDDADAAAVAEQLHETLGVEPS